jgi:hypothetical protein
MAFFGIFGEKGMQMDQYFARRLPLLEIRHPSHFFENLIGNIGCASSKYRKI